MNEDIDRLNELAKQLLQQVDELETKTARHGALPLSAELLADVQSLFGLLCKGLTELIDIIGEADGPLARLVGCFEGGQVLSNATDAAKRFIDTHRTALDRIGIRGKIAESLIEDIEDDIQNGAIRLHEAVTLSESDREVILAPVRRLRDLICEIQQNADLLADVWDPEVAKACVDGIKGVGRIVFDITTALTVPHTVIVLLVAANSTWSGVRQVKKSVEKLEASWKSLRQHVIVKRKQAKLGKKPKGPFDKK